MSFCRSLWLRINPGIKTDFPGSNLPSSIDFFTLMESVLPNLTWQWFCTMGWEHLGNSQKELLVSFLSVKYWGGGGGVGIGGEEKTQTTQLVTRRVFTVWCFISDYFEWRNNANFRSNVSWRCLRKTHDSVKSCLWQQSPAASAPFPHPQHSWMLIIQNL